MSDLRWSGSKAWAAYVKHRDGLIEKGLEDRPSFVNFLEEYIGCPRCLGTGRMTVNYQRYQRLSCSQCGGLGKVQRVNLYFEEGSEKCETLLWKEALG